MTDRLPISTQISVKGMQLIHTYDNRPLDDREKQLAEECFPLACTYASYFLKQWQELREDAPSLAALAAMRAARSFVSYEPETPEERKECLKRWVRICTKHVAFKAIEKHQRYGHLLVKYSEAVNCDGLDADTPTEHWEIAEEATRLLSLLGARNSAVVALWMAREVGTVPTPGISESTSKRIYRKSMEDLKQLAANRETRLLKGVGA